jgi:serine/threonine-protein kinase RsbW
LEGVLKPERERVRSHRVRSSTTELQEPSNTEEELPALHARVLPFLKERISLTMPSDITYLDEVLDYLNRRLLELGIVGPGDSDVIIALDEAIVNAIKHGNKNDPSKTVRIVAELTARGARFTVRDEGSGFSRDGLPDPTDPLRLLVPSGRGLLLISHIMDDVHHNECGNEICMSRRVARSLNAHHRRRGKTRRGKTD